MMDAEQAVRIMYAEEINTDKNKTALIAEKTRNMQKDRAVH